MRLMGVKVLFFKRMLKNILKKLIKIKSQEIKQFKGIQKSSFIKKKEMGLKEDQDFDKIIYFI